MVISDFTSRLRVKEVLLKFILETDAFLSSTTMNFVWRKVTVEKYLTSIPFNARKGRGERVPTQSVVPKLHRKMSEISRHLHARENL
jgi:hypothetical protein